MLRKILLFISISSENCNGCVDTVFPGYRIRLGSSSDVPNTGRLHVDFAHARDDQYEWECKQRQIQREQRHRERLMRDNNRDVSPSAPSHYTESEANSVLEKLKG